MPPDPPNSLICSVFLVLDAAGPRQCERLEPPVLGGGHVVPQHTTKTDPYPWPQESRATVGLKQHYNITRDWFMSTEKEVKINLDYYIIFRHVIIMRHIFFWFQTFSLLWASNEPKYYEKEEDFVYAHHNGQWADGHPYVTIAWLCNYPKGEIL